MSEQRVLDFIEATLNDPGLLGKCKGAPDLPAVIAVAAQAGYDFTAEHVRASAVSLDQAAGQLRLGELSDDALDAVVGGVNINNNHYPTEVFVNINNNHREIFGQFGVVGSITSVL